MSKRGSDANKELEEAWRESIRVRFNIVEKEIQKMQDELEDLKNTLRKEIEWINHP